MNAWTLSGSTYGVYQPPGGGPTIVQDAVPRTQYDVDIYKIKSEQELATLRLRHELDRETHKEVWNINKPQILDKLERLEAMVKEVRELIYT